MNVKCIPHSQPCHKGHYSMHYQKLLINLLHILYIALFWVLKALYNLLNHHQCAASTWMMRRQPYCARTPTTHQPIRGWLGGHDYGQRPMGEFDQDAGVTPLLFFEGHPGIFNDHRESGPHFLTSHPIFFSFRSTTFMAEQPFEENLVE